MCWTTPKLIILLSVLGVLFAARVAVLAQRKRASQHLFDLTLKHSHLVDPLLQQHERLQREEKPNGATLRLRLFNRKSRELYSQVPQPDVRAAYMVARRWELLDHAVWLVLQMAALAAMWSVLLDGLPPWFKIAAAMSAIILTDRWNGRVRTITHERCDCCRQT